MDDMEDFGAARIIDITDEDPSDEPEPRTRNTSGGFRVLEQKRCLYGMSSGQGRRQPDSRVRGHY